MYLRQFYNFDPETFKSVLGLDLQGTFQIVDKETCR